MLREILHNVLVQIDIFDSDELQILHFSHGERVKVRLKSSREAATHVIEQGGVTATPGVIWKTDERQCDADHEKKPKDEQDVLESESWKNLEWNKSDVP